MSLLQIVLRSLRQHTLSTVITAFSIALASGLLMSVWVVKDQARENFTGVDSGFDGVFGARGSKLLTVHCFRAVSESARLIMQAHFDAVEQHPRIRERVMAIAERRDLQEPQKTELIRRIVRKQQPPQQYSSEFTES